MTVGLLQGVGLADRLFEPTLALEQENQRKQSDAQVDLFDHAAGQRDLFLQTRGNVRPTKQKVAAGAVDLIACRCPEARQRALV